MCARPLRDVSRDSGAAQLNGPRGAAWPLCARLPTSKHDDVVNPGVALIGRVRLRPERPFFEKRRSLRESSFRNARMCVYVPCLCAFELACGSLLSTEAVRDNLKQS